MVKFRDAGEMTIHRTTNRDLAAIREYLSMGLCFAETARRVGCAPATVRYWAHKANLSFVPLPVGSTARRGPNGKWLKELRAAGH